MTFYPECGKKKETVLLGSKSVKVYFRAPSESLRADQYLQASHAFDWERVFTIGTSFRRFSGV